MKKLLIFIFVLTLLVNAQEKKEIILAEFAGHKITAEEFKLRFQFMPQKGSPGIPDEVKKIRLLHTMIAEKLWAEEAREKGYDTTEAIRISWKNIEKMYARDALHKIEVEDKSNPPKESVIMEYAKLSRTLLIKYMLSPSRERIFTLYDSLNSGVSFEALLKNRPEKMHQDTAIVVKSGDSAPDVEEELFRLNKGEYTPPLQTEHGWYIFYLEDFIPKAATEKELVNLQKEARKLAREKLSSQNYNDYFRDFFKDKKVSSDGYLFWSFADQVVQIFKEKKKSGEEQKKGAWYLGKNDYETIRKNLGPDTLNMSYIKLDDKNVTMKEFLRTFFFDGFYSSTADADTLRAKLNSRIKSFIEMELLSDEAFSRGLNKQPEVTTFTDMWRDHYLAGHVKNEMLSQAVIAPGEVKEHYDKNRDKLGSLTEINILEILTDSLEVIEEAFRRLDNGEDFRMIAREHTKREWTREKGGEFGWFPYTFYKEIGPVAKELEMNEIFGPLETDNGYSLFKLIGRREPGKEKMRPFEEVKDKLRAKLKMEKVENLQIRKTVELARKYDLKVYEDLLKSVKVTNFNMLVFKYFGFGGHMLAVPVTTPFEKWFEYWKQNKTLP